MLIPVILRADFKIATGSPVTCILENLLSNNLPLLWPEVLVMNRTVAAGSVTISGVTNHSFQNRADADFNGLVATTPFLPFVLGSGTDQKVSGLSNTLLPTSAGVTNEITFDNAGVETPALISLELTGWIESAVSPDPLTIVNV